MRTVHRTLHYRHAWFISPTNGLTLETYLDPALKALPTAEKRKRQIGTTDDYELLNTHGYYGSTLCGEFHRWTKGEHQLVVTQVPGAATWKIDEVEPPSLQPNSDGSKPSREFLPHTLYFGVRENHCVVAQTQGLKATHLAEFFSWLVHQNNHPSQQVALNPASAAMLRLTGVGKAKGVSIRSRLYDEVEQKPTGKQKNPVITKVFKPGLSAKLKGLLIELGVPIGSEIDAEEAKHLELKLEIRNPHDRSEVGNIAMNQIADLVSQETDDDYAVILEDDSLLRGTELALKKPITFELKDGITRPPFMDVFKQLDAYLTELIALKRI